MSKSHDQTRSLKYPWATLEPASSLSFCHSFLRGSHRLTRRLLAITPVSVSAFGIPQQNGYTFMRKVLGLGVEAPATPTCALNASPRAEDGMPIITAGFQRNAQKSVEAFELLMVM